MCLDEWELRQGRVWVLRVWRVRRCAVQCIVLKRYLVVLMHKSGVPALALLAHARSLLRWLHRCRVDLHAACYAHTQVCYAMQEADLAMLTSKHRDAGTLVRNSISLLACQVRPEQRRCLGCRFLGAVRVTR